MNVNAHVVLVSDMSSADWNKAAVTVGVAGQASVGTEKSLATPGTPHGDSPALRCLM